MENIKSYSNLSINTIQRGLEKKGHDGTDHGNAYDAVSNFSNFKSALLAAAFSPFLGISVVIYEIWHNFTAKGKVDDFVDFSNAVIFSGENTDFTAGQFQVIESADKTTVSINDKITKETHVYQGSKAKLIKELEIFQYGVYRSADENIWENNCAPVRIAELNTKINDAKMEIAKQCTKKTLPTEFEYNGSPNTYQKISSIAVLKQQFDTLCNLFGEDLHKKNIFKDNPANVAAIVGNSYASDIKYNIYGRGGKMVVYVTPDRIEEVWRKCQKFVQDADYFTDIKCFFADPESKYRPKEHANNYSVIFYIGDFFGENAAVDARRLLVDEGIVNKDDPTKFIDDEQPDLASWTFPEFPTKESKNKQVQAGLQEIARKEAEYSLEIENKKKLNEI